jgi:hypothetical protein
LRQEATFCLIKSGLLKRKYGAKLFLVHISQRKCN